MATDAPLDAARRSTGALPIPTLIRTPDQRVRVFVSSTLDELAPERAAAREAITQLRLTPVLFESGARPYPPRELYRAYLAQSDIFIGLYWQRYGWVAPGMQISGLEDEYQLAGLAEIAAAQGQAERAGRLFGAASRLLPATSTYRSEVHRRSTAARAHLDAATFEAGWAA